MTQKIMFNLNHYIVIEYGPLDNLIENTYLKKKRSFGFRKMQC